ncbi:uncharacterized protein LOC100256797 isoform X2 [Vitis vinifera]|uniref:uncharacterized protein LOC100256797 isoform X2 n=1 Tax=Vitis vinifera TaxID=29760 RepID=UPI002882FCF5|nr:uncharacterized protein LOC100256797 isoform X2 [Vitis vinifera]
MPFFSFFLVKIWVYDFSAAYQMLLLDDPLLKNHYYSEHLGVRYVKSYLLLLGCLTAFLHILSASEAGEIQFLDMRNGNHVYLTIDAHRGSLTALAVQQHAPLIASGSAKQFIKVFSLEGSQRCTIRFNPTSIARKIGPVSHLTFHPYQVLLAAGAADALVSIYGVTFCCPNTSSHSMFLEMLCACCVEIVCYIFISLHWIGSLMLGSYLDALANNLSLSLYIYTHTCIHKKLSRSFLIFSFFFFLGVFFLLHHFAEFVKAANFIIIIILSVADK